MHQLTAVNSDVEQDSESDGDHGMVITYHYLITIKCGQYNILCNTLPNLSKIDAMTNFNTCSDITDIELCNDQ